MSINEASHETLQKMINLLDQAIYNHQQWHNALIRTFVCRLPPDQHDMATESFKQCRFGQWYYSEQINDLGDHPGFKALGEEHVRMHHLAQSLLSTSASGATITSADYDNFSNALERFRLEIFSLKRELENLLYNRDALTGTINRVNMLSLLREQQEILKRENATAYLAMMDLDHFKNINDRYSHPVGDQVLRSVGQYLIGHLRSSDRIFRYGGEEFLVYLNKTDAKTAFELIENVRKGLAETDLVKDPQIRVTVSAGLASLDPFSSAETTIERADKALLVAKSAGGNNTQTWNPTS